MHVNIRIFCSVILPSLALSAIGLLLDVDHAYATLKGWPDTRWLHHTLASNPSLLILLSLLWSARAQNRFREPHITIKYNLNNKISKEPDQVVEISDEEEEKLIKMLLRKGGINLDSDDEYAQMAKIGLKDRNPERILRHCEHLFTEILTYGMMWNMFSLPSTGRKILFCGKTNYSVSGIQLDHLLDNFKRDYCDSCSFRNQRAEEWKWNRQWRARLKNPCERATAP